MPDETEASARAAPQRLVPDGLERRLRLDPILVAAIASVAWLITIGAYAFGFFAGAAAPPAPQPQALSVMLFLLGALGPVALMVLGAALATQIADLKREITRLGNHSSPRSQPEHEQRYARQAAQHGAAALAKLEALQASVAALTAMAETEEAPTVSLATGRSTGRPAPAPADDQAVLPLDEAAAVPVARVPWADIIRALDFPRDGDDQRGFEAVRSAIRDPEIAQLLQAAEDVLTILAADGLHMEDHVPQHASLAAWRAYADGVRGEAVAAIGGITEEAALERTHARLRADPIFRDAGLVFIRRWNGLISRILVEMGEDPALRDVADTRSGRAFMLVARAMGVFGTVA